MSKREQLAIEALRNCASAFIVLFGDTNGAVPETVPTRLGVPLRLRQIVSDAQAALAVPVEPVPLPEPAPADGWQPIETAPFDGSTVLTINERDLYPVAAFFCEVWLRETDGPEDVVIAGRHEPLYRPPTHWRPLPSPPVVEGKP